MPLSKGDRRRHRSSRLLPLVLVLALAVSFAVDHIFFPPPMRSFQQQSEMMDTWLLITVYDRDPDRAARAIEAAFSRMEEIEQIASIFDDQAEAYRLNEQGHLDDPPRELLEIIEAAKKANEISEGAFDITVEPLLELWRYKPEADRQFWELEDAEQREAILETLAVVGSDKVSVTTDPHPVIVLEPGTKITLGGIAKGYAVDQGLEALRSAGVKHGLIDAGGDIGTFGGKPGDETWEIDLRNPNDPEDCLARFVLVDGAIAT